MKVLDLRCANDHRFEGWFSSDADYHSQLERSMIECPLCGDHAVTRLPSAPRLNVSGAQEPRQSAMSNAAGSNQGQGQGSGQASAQPTPHGGGAGGGGGGAAGAPDAPAAPSGLPVEQMQHLQAQWMQAVRHAIANTEDVGQHFAEEARRMHYGETDERAIRGSTSREEARSLRDEGIDVVAIPIPAALKGTLQ